MAAGGTVLPEGERSTDVRIKMREALAWIDDRDQALAVVAEADLDHGAGVFKRSADELAAAPLEQINRSTVAAGERQLAVGSKSNLEDSLRKLHGGADRLTREGLQDLH